MRPSRPHARSQWGWSAVQVVKVDRTPEAKLRRIVQQLPRRTSSIERIVADLCEYGARFHSGLAQDEFGPTRAERAAALRESLEALEQARSAIEDLSPAARQLVADAFSAMPRTVVGAAVDPLARFEADKLAVEELWLAATEASHRPRSGGGSKDLDAIAALLSFAQRAYLLLQSLDTTTEGDLIFPPAPTPVP
jgi:hypothetical protein